jgi:hypothetical protein
VAAHDALDRRQTQSPSAELGGEERFEHALDLLGVHAHALVADLHERVRPGGLPAMRAVRDQLVVPQVPAPGAHLHDPARVGDRLGGVGDQVQDHLPELGRIGRDPLSLVAGHPDLGLGPTSDLQQRQQLLDQRAEVHGHLPEWPPTGIIEHQLTEIGRAVGRALDGTERVPRRLTVAKPRDGELGVRHHPHQQVVEVVRDATGQHAQALELLRVKHARFQLQPLALGVSQRGDVGRHTQHVPGDAVRIDQRAFDGLERPYATGGVGDALVVDPELLEGVHHPQVVLPEVFDLGVVRVEIGVRPAHQVGRRRSVGLCHRRVHQREPPLAVLHEQEVRVDVDDLPQEGAALRVVVHGRIMRETRGPCILPAWTTAGRRWWFEKRRPRSPG